MGIRGNLYARVLEANPYAEFAAFSEASPQAFARLREEFDCPGHSDYREMLSGADLDIIIIALPDHLHRQAVLAAADAGCHLLIEKPFATSLEDALAMTDAIKEAGVQALVAFENRWSPVMAAAYEAIEEGDLGPIQQMHLQLNDSIEVPIRMLSWGADTTPGWFLFPHIVDLALWFTGKRPEAVTARSAATVLRERGVDTLDWMTALVDFPGQTLTTLNSNWIYPESLPLIYDLRVDVVGSRGALAVDLRDQMIHKMVDRYSHPPTLGRPIYGRPVGFAAAMLDDFIDNVRLGTAPRVSIEEALENVRIIEKIHHSAGSNGGKELIEETPG